ncbi:relaxase domain-containing protein [Streptomyces sp. NPDC091387]|uniref:relaxase domain-containing protein n=1 Tax=Streptomyces sp. NPDC091387 TaxID=3365998 RepID=UPI003829FAFC
MVLGRAKTPALVVAAFRHFDNRDGAPLLRDHCLVLNCVQRLDDDGEPVWGAVDTRRLYHHGVADGTLYTLARCANPSLAATSWLQRAGTSWRPCAAVGSRAAWTTTSPTRPSRGTPVRSPCRRRAVGPRRRTGSVHRRLRRA